MTPTRRARRDDDGTRLPAAERPQPRTAAKPLRMSEPLPAEPVPAAPDLPAAGVGEPRPAPWQTLMFLPQRLFVTWVESHIRLTETMIEIVALELSETQETVRDALALAERLGSEPDPARRVELQLGHAWQMAERVMARGTARYERALRAQVETTELLVRRAQELAAELRDVTPGDPRG